MMKIIKPLTGGQRNHVTLCYNSSKYFVRKKIPKKSFFDFYTCEKNTLIKLKDLNISPTLIQFNDSEQTLDIEYLKGMMIDETVSTDELVELVNKLNSIKFNEKPFWMFRRVPEKDCKDIINLFAKNGYIMSDIVEKQHTKMFDENIYDVNSLIHGSLIPSNILKTSNGLKLVDFEMASHNNSWLDLAYIGAHISVPFTKELIKKYSESNNISSETAKNSFDYARYHLCALSLALYQKNLKNEEFLSRHDKLIDILSYDFWNDSNLELRNFYKEMKK